MTGSGYARSIRNNAFKECVPGICDYSLKVAEIPGSNPGEPMACYADENPVKDFLDAQKPLAVSSYADAIEPFHGKALQDDFLTEVRSALLNALC